MELAADYGAGAGRRPVGVRGGIVGCKL